MRIALTSDLHLGITKDKSIVKMLQKLKHEKPHVLVIAGDFNGGKIAHRAIKTIAKILRKELPEIPMVAVLGNHDYWTVGKKLPDDGFYKSYLNPSVRTFDNNYNTICSIMKEHNIKLLEEDKLYVHSNFQNVKFIGHGGWYKNPNPPTNDKNFLPIGIQGNTNNYLYNRAMKSLQDSIDELDKIYTEGDKVIFVSHFPVVNTGNDYKGAFEDFSWNSSIQNILNSKYNCIDFLCGHAHQKHIGPLRYESGSDYYSPDYIIIEV